MNLLWHDSVISLYEKKKLESLSDAQALIQNHVPLKVDGNFGEKTESCVKYFEKYLNLQQNGIVTEFIWTQILQYADKLIQRDVMKPLLNLIDPLKLNMQQSNAISVKDQTKTQQQPIAQ